ncbi:hypothetical protein KNJ79_02215 [Sphingopyxis indica]|uniref:hypothetical protein n=1 Tax=Sphingopyxis indica TaxID=436663 RepID=UPI0029395455|nr:hypothetical protein [Sphingopyxis indica]WOF43800.1 hypothetical protein KNJ79_02215 [Sphingopyxis indica]
MSDDIGKTEFRRADERDNAQVHAFAERFRAATLEMADTIPDTRVLLSQSMTAAIVFAGIQYGGLVAMGDVPDNEDELHSMFAAVRHNFDVGIALGKAHAARAISQNGMLN